MQICIQSNLYMVHMHQFLSMPTCSHGSLLASTNTLENSNSVMFTMNNHHSIWKLFNIILCFQLSLLTVEPRILNLTKQGGKEVRGGWGPSWELTLATRIQILSKSHINYLWLPAKLYRFLENEPTPPSIWLC